MEVQVTIRQRRVFGLLWKSVAVTTLAFALAACQAKPTFNEEIKLRDLTPPQVFSIIPANGETEVSDKPTITVVFSEPMNAATLNSSTMTVKSQNGNSAVGFFTYDEAQNALSFTVTQRLYVNTSYVVSLTSGMKDKAGNSLVEFTSTFSTDVCPKAKAANWAFNGAVNAIAKTGCTLYLGGYFTSVGIANSYGTAIDALSGKVPANFNYPAINGAVYAVASDGNGGWYLGGDFTRIGGVARQRLAHIAASGELLPWNPGANGTVYSLAVSGSTVYVGGWFTTIGGVIRNGLAAFNTDTGTLLSWNPNANNSVHSLAVVSSTVYVGGWFTTIGGITRNRLAAINTNTGTLLSWNPNADNVVRTLAVVGSTVYVGGGFTTIGGITRNRLAASGTDGSLLSWNPNANNLVNTLAVSGSTVYVGGWFTTIGGNIASCIASLNLDGSLNW